MSEFELDSTERNSALWLKITRHLEYKLAVNRKRNDDDRWDVIETAKLRGRIAEIKDLLRLGTDADAPVSDK